MNTLLNKLLGVTTICFLILMGCDSSQVVEDSIPKIPKPFVFNPSVNLIAIDPGSFVRVTDQQQNITCLLYTSPSPRDKRQSRMPSSA